MSQKFDNRVTTRMAERSSLTTAELLEVLFVEYGASSTDLAQLTKTSRTEVHNWYHGREEPRPSNTSVLLRLASFLDIIREERPDQEPMGWMESYLPLPAGFNIRPMNLYYEGRLTALGSYLTGETTVEEMLDAVRPNWRDQRSPWETFTDGDGERSLRLREGESA
jgi:hypothetical protein